MLRSNCAARLPLTSPQLNPWCKPMACDFSEPFASARGEVTSRLNASQCGQQRDIHHGDGTSERPSATVAETFVEQRHTRAAQDDDEHGARDQPSDVSPPATGPTCGSSTMAT
jgi:hypothetical protein